MSELSEALVRAGCEGAVKAWGEGAPADYEPEIRDALAAAFEELFKQGYVCAYPNHNVERPTLHIFALAREIERGA